MLVVTPLLWSMAYYHTDARPVAPAKKVDLSVKVNSGNVEEKERKCARSFTPWRGNLQRNKRALTYQNNSFEMIRCDFATAKRPVKPTKRSMAYSHPHAHTHTRPVAPAKKVDPSVESR